jgi:alpha-tubulin suppressor-like RCC1 family protein
VAGGLTFDSLTVGELHACGLTASGEGYCWGLNADGQLGNGAITAVNEGESAPVAIGGGLRFVSLSAGERHTCGVTAGGDGYCWGDNSAGQVGGGSFTELTPRQVRDAPPFVAIAAGGLHTCALAESGAAWCWGAGNSGQLGHGSTNSSTRPVQVAGGHVFVQLGARRQYSCGLTSAGRAYCWGQNLYGQLGIGRANPNEIVSLPTGVAGVP